MRDLRHIGKRQDSELVRSWFFAPKIGRQSKMVVSGTAVGQHETGQKQMSNEVGSHTTEPFLHCARSGREKKEEKLVGWDGSVRMAFYERGLDVITT